MHARKFLVFLFVIWMSLILISCVKEEDPQISRITVIAEGSDDVFDIDLFQWSDLVLKIEFTDGSVLFVPVTEAMMSASDQQVKQRTGTHDIVIRYQGNDIPYRITLKFAELKAKLMEIYMLAVSSQSLTMTYEEWLESIKGQDGKSIIDAYLLHGHLFLRFSDDTIIDVGQIVGSDGHQVELRVHIDQLQWRYEHEDTWQTLIDIGLLKGKDGVGTASVTIDEQGHLWIVLSDGTETDLGPIIGRQGDQGIGIKHVTINTEGHLVLTYSDDSTVDLGFIHGNDGDSIELKATDTHVMWKRTQDDAWNSLIPLSVLTGAEGRGIQSSSISATGELIVLFSDGTTQNLGQILKLHTVIFKDSSGFVIDVQMVLQHHDGVYPTPIQKVGYVFVGWQGSVLDVTSDRIITAEYQPLVFTVEFRDDDLDVFPKQQIPYGATIDLPEPIKEGYVFKGWYEGVGANVAQIFNSTSIQKDYVLYARWELKWHTVIFLDDQGMMLSVQRISHQASAIPPNAPQKYGYVHVGWSHDYKTITGDLAIRAMYALGNFAITYVNPDGSIERIQPMTYTDLVTIEVPERDGYVFTGWKIVTPVYQGYSFLRWQESDQYLEDDFKITKDLIVLPTWQAFSDIFNFIVYTDTVYITLYKGDSERIFLPDVIFDKPLGGIHDGAFFQCDGLTHLYLNESLEYIASDAFFGSSIEFLRVNRSLVLNPSTEIFSGMMYLKTLIFDPENSLHTISSQTFSGASQLETLILPHHLSTIADQAFMHHASLKSIFIPKSVAWIGAESFKSASSLKVVEFEAGSLLQFIHSETFMNANQLEAVINIPAQVNTIGIRAFQGATRLKTVTFEPGSQLSIIEDYAFHQTHSLETFDVPATVFRIGDYAFKYATELISVSFAAESSLAQIGLEAFAENWALTSFFIPENVQSLGDAFLINATSLETLTISNQQLLMIPYQAFMNANKLRTIIGFPDAVTHIKDEAFKNCFSLLDIGLTESSQLVHIGKSAFERNYALKQLYVPSQLLIIDEYAFHLASSLETITFSLDATLHTIKEGAFLKASSLRSLDFPGSLKIIGDYAFQDNRSLESIVFDPMGVLETIGNAAFMGCESVASLELPASLKHIKTAAFVGMTRLSQIIFDDQMSLITFGSMMFAENEALLSIRLPEGIQTLLSGTFGHSRLKRIELPQSIAFVEPFAFNRTSYLEEVIFHPDSEFIFLPEYVFKESNVQKIVLPKHLKEIQDYAFWQTYDLQEIVIPADSELTTLHPQSFHGAHRLKTLYIPLSLTGLTYDIFQHFAYMSSLTIHPDHPEFVLSNGVLYKRDLSEMIYYPKCLPSESFAIPVTVTSVREEMFASLSYLKELVIHAGLESLGNRPFQYSLVLERIIVDANNTHYAAINHVLFTKDLKTLIRYPLGLAASTYVLPQGVMHIHTHAFYGHEHLTELMLGNSSLISIGSYAFVLMPLVQSITIPETVRTIDEYAVMPSQNAPYEIIVLRNDMDPVPILGAGAFGNPYLIQQIVVPSARFVSFFNEPSWLIYQSVLVPDEPMMS